MTDEQFNLKLLKIGILSDILESEIKALRPEKYLQDKVFAMKIRNAQIHTSSLRKYFDRLLKPLIGLIGDYYDSIDQTIDLKIKELDYEKK